MINLENLEQVVTLASDTISVSKNGAALARSIQSLFKKSQAADDAELKAAISDLLAHVGNAALTNTELQMKLAELHKKAQKDDQFQRQMLRYELHETSSGGIVYRLKADQTEGEPMHYLCPNCVESDHRSILQGDRWDKGCPRCSTSYQFDDPERGAPGEYAF